MSVATDVWTNARPVAMGWPVVPGDLAPAVEALHERLRARRGGSEVTAQWEVELPGHVRTLVDEAITNPAHVGLDAIAAADLSGDAQRRQAFEWYLMARASLLWPLSLLIYRGDVEEIRRIDGRWMVENGDGSIAIEGEQPQAFRPRDGMTTDKLVEGWLSTVLSTRGVTGARSLADSSPMIEASMSTSVGPARIAAMVAPALTGIPTVALTIRIPSTTGPQTLEEFVERETIPAPVARFLQAAVRAPLSILIAGGTGTGKTALMRALAGEIPDDGRPITTIEDNAELGLSDAKRDGRPWHRPTIAMATVTTVVNDGEDPAPLWKLVRHALRHRPTRILLGEARGQEMAEVASAMTSGHEGSMVTIHANSAMEAMAKAAQYIGRSEEFRGQMTLAHSLAHQAIALCVHLGRNRAGRRIVTGVVAYNENGEPTPVYALDEYGMLRQEAFTWRDLPTRVSAPLERHLTEIPAI